MEPVGVPLRRQLLDAGVLTGCRHRVGLDHDPTAVSPQGPEDPGVAQRRAGAVEARARVRERLRAEAARTGGRWVDVTGTGGRERVAATVAALHSDAERIWGATLPADLDAGRRGSVELLVRSAAGGWIPVLITNHRVSDPGSGALTTDLHRWAPASDETRSARRHPCDQLRLAHAFRLLQHCGAAGADGDSGAVGGVIGLDADCIVVHELDAPTWATTPGAAPHSTLTELDLRFADRRAVADGVLATRARRVGECRTCPWWPRCSAELTAAHDVSLVVRGAQLDVLGALGVSTIDALAAWEGPEPAEWRGGAFADAVVLARAWLAGVPLVRRGQVHLRRADVEVDVDMESHLEDGAYLWGTLLTEGGHSAGYRPFVTWEPLPCADEARSFAEFWAWLRAVQADATARGRSFAAYCYSEAAENRWMLGSAQRFAGVAGIPTLAEVQAFLDSDDWVDVYATVARDFLCPNGKGLKKIAPVAGFGWRDADAGGEASMGWYRRAVGLDGPVEPDQRQRLLDYNADDVMATKVLREWMTSAAVLDVPEASQL
ncbi:MAG: TM0106 family RecB-like putative nuclease [Mycobacteriaceae bacterium]